MGNRCWRKIIKGMTAWDIYSLHGWYNPFQGSFQGLEECYRVEAKCYGVREKSYKQGLLSVSSTQTTGIFKMLHLSLYEAPVKWVVLVASFTRDFLSPFTFFLALCFYHTCFHSLETGYLEDRLLCFSQLGTLLLAALGNSALFRNPGPICYPVERTPINLILW